MPLFRAVPINHPSTDGKPQWPRDSVRLPSNVSYVVDNLWEYLRPNHLPSRRHAVYASPTPELALQCATPPDRDVDLGVYEVMIDGPFSMVQLQIEDARHHRDIAAVAKTLQKVIPALLSASLEERQVASLFFMPGCSKSDWALAVEQSPVAADFSAATCAQSTFWNEITTEPTDVAGELFFQLGAGSSYQLINPVPGGLS